MKNLPCSQKTKLSVTKISLLKINKICCITIKRKKNNYTKI